MKEGLSRRNCSWGTLRSKCPFSNSLLFPRYWQIPSFPGELSEPSIQGSGGGGVHSGGAAAAAKGAPAATAALLGALLALLAPPQRWFVKKWTRTITTWKRPSCTQCTRAHKLSYEERPSWQLSYGGEKLERPSKDREGERDPSLLRFPVYISEEDERKKGERLKKGFSSSLFPKDRESKGIMIRVLWGFWNSPVLLPQGQKKKKKKGKWWKYIYNPDSAL